MPDENLDSAPPRDRERWFVQSLERGLAVLGCFDEAHPNRSLSEVAKEVGATRATARRLLLTLVELGFVQQNGRLFSLTPRVLSLGYSYLSGVGMTRAAEPHLEELARQLGETASLAVLDGVDIVYVARVPSARVLQVIITVGTRFPAHATSSGRVLLAGLPEPELADYFHKASITKLTPRTETDLDRLQDAIATTRAQGWAEVSDELDLGMHATSVPVRDRRGAVLAALNVSLHASEHSEERLHNVVLPALLDAAKSIEWSLRAR